MEKTTGEGGSDENSKVLFSLAGWEILLTPAASKNQKVVKVSAPFAPPLLPPLSPFIVQVPGAC